MFKKKILLLVLPVVLLGSVVAFAQEPVTPTFSEQVQIESSEAIPTVEPTVLPTATPIAEPTATPTPVPTPTFAPVRYGQDANRSGWFVVNDKEWVLTQAGITGAERFYADKVLSHWSKENNWVYKSPTGTTGSNGLCGSFILLYFADNWPMARPHGAGFPTNDPVAQVALCTQYIAEKFKNEAPTIGVWFSAYRQNGLVSQYGYAD